MTRSLVVRARFDPTSSIRILDLCGSEALWFQESVDEVKHQPGSHEGCESIVENHERPPLQPVAGVGVADRHREKDETEGYKDDIEHYVLLSNARYAVERLCN
jgi:hypothetical protein